MDIFKSMIPIFLIFVLTIVGIFSFIFFSQNTLGSYQFTAKLIDVKPATSFLNPNAIYATFDNGQIIFVDSPPNNITINASYAVYLNWADYYHLMTP